MKTKTLHFAACLFAGALVFAQLHTPLQAAAPGMIPDIAQTATDNGGVTQSAANDTVLLAPVNSSKSERMDYIDLPYTYPAQYLTYLPGVYDATGMTALSAVIGFSSAVIGSQPAINKASLDLNIARHPAAPVLFTNQHLTLEASLGFYYRYDSSIGFGVMGGSAYPFSASFQWQLSKNNGTNWSNTGTLTVDSYDASAYGTLTNTLDAGLLTTDMNGWQYRLLAVVKDGADFATAITGTTITSEPITLTVKPSHLVSPSALTVDSSGNLFVADPAANAIWKITPSNKVSLFAGSPAGASGTTDAEGTAARFNKPNGIALHSGTIFVADSGNNAIRAITPSGLVSTFAGMAGVRGYKEAAGAEARFNYPMGITADSAGNLYVADTGNNYIRKITPDGATSWVAGLYSPWSGGVGATGKLTKTGNSQLEFNNATLTVGLVSGTLVCNTTGTSWFGGGVLHLDETSLSNITGMTSGTLNLGQTVLVDGNGYYSGTLIALDGSLIILSGSIDVTGTDSSIVTPDASSYYFNNPTRLTLSPDGKQLYVADSQNGALCAVDLATGAVVPVDINLIYPTGLRFDKNNNLYVADTGASAVIKVASSGSTTVLAGDFDYNYLDGNGYEASFNGLSDIAVDSSGNLYIADMENAVIRKIAQTGTSATVSTITLGVSTDTGGSESSGGGGGGAPSAWYLLVLCVLAAARPRRE